MREFEAEDWRDATRIAGTHIGNFLQRPNEFVWFNPETSTFVVGAGLWSRRGYYSLSPLD